jgi:uncharacterized membrane protein YoaK (UPF0700 family)
MNQPVQHDRANESWAIQILLLTWAAGTVDAIGYLALHHVFTANMTGNAVLLGMALGQGQGLAALRNVLALAGFIAGAAIGALLVHRRRISAQPHRALILPILTEAVVLAVFALILQLLAPSEGAPAFYAIIFAAAFAMGVQSAAVQALHLPGIATIVITGTITSLIAGAVRRFHPSTAWSEEEPDVKSRANRHLSLQAGVFAVYLAAAACSSLLQKRIPIAVGLSAVVAVALVFLHSLFTANSHHPAEAAR